MVRNYNDYWNNMMSMTDPIGDATRDYLDRKASEEEQADREYNATPECCYCGDKITISDGCYEDTIRIRGHKETVLLCRSCYENGLEGGTYYDPQDVREYLLKEA